jgi:hypothetical protein
MGTKVRVHNTSDDVDANGRFVKMKLEKVLALPAFNDHVTREVGKKHVEAFKNEMRKFFNPNEKVWIAAEQNDIYQGPIIEGKGFHGSGCIFK